MRENRPGTVAKLILAVLMSVSISQSFYSSLFMTQKLSNTIFLAIVPMILLLYIMFKNKITTIISSILILLGLAALFFNIFFETKNSYKIFNYFDWLMALANDDWVTTSEFYYTLTEVLLLFIVALLVFLFTVKFFNFYLMAFAGLAIFFIQLQFDFFSSTQAYIMFVFSLVLYYFFSILHRRKKVYSYDVGNKLKYLVFIIPVCIIVLLISTLFPVREDRLTWEWLDVKADTAVNGVVEFFEERFAGKDMGVFEYFSIGSTGFGNSDRLGGNISLDNTHVLNVKSEHPNLYLKGTSRVFYDGHRWYDDTQYTPAGNSIEEYSAMLDIFHSSNMTDFFTAAQAEVEFVDLRTKSLFVPHLYHSLKFSQPLDLFFDNEQSLSAGEILSSGFSYNINYDHVLLSDNEFQNLLRQSHTGYVTIDIVIDLVKTLSEKYRVNIALPRKEVINGKVYYSGDLSFVDSYLQYMKTMQNKYTILPPTITSRVQQLAEDITRDKDNNYDKARAIESYLSTHYPYTLRPGNPPSNQDFVDYFLFDGKQGYCTYYASAMTVMLRSIDIPARFVEGYILPPASNGSNIYQVTNQQAHAWVEVFFEGFGWIPFEPTSPFASNMYSDRNIQANISPDMQNRDYDDYMDMINQYRDEQPPESSLPDTTNDSPDEKEKFEISRTVLIWMVLALILLAFIVFVAVQRARHQTFIRNIRRKQPKHAVLMAYSYILILLFLHKIAISSGETPSQFGERVDKIPGFKGFAGVTEHFVKARYSTDTLSPEERQEMLLFIDLLLKYTNKNMNKFKLLINKYIRGLV